MKPIYEGMAPLAATEVVAFQIVKGRDFGCQWHFHPELELTFIVSGGTHRWIGDNISPLRSGDLVLIGSNLPHDYRNDCGPTARFEPVHAIVLQFHPNFLGSAWLGQRDMTRTHQLFQQAGHGLEIHGTTRDKVVSLLERVEPTHGIHRLILTLEILATLSFSRDLKPIASAGFSPEVQISDGKRMGAISAYIQKHVQEPLYVRDVAQRAGMSEVSFSRYFRSRTGKTFPAYLNEIRVARVCRLLAETDATITEIAFSCGFDAMANFEKQFGRLQGCSPREYRQAALRTSIAAR